MKIESKIFFLTLTAAASLLTACQDEDFGYAADDIKYEKNFTDVYGPISPDQNWDLSSSAGWTDPSFCLDTRATMDVTPTNPLTKSNDGVQTGHYTVKDQYWQIPTEFLNWFEDYLVEGHDNRYLGSSFILEMPKNDFVIVPMFQGASAIMSDLEMKVNGYDMTTIWRKSSGIQVQDVENGDWLNLGYFDGRSQYTTYEDASTSGVRAAETLNVKGLRSKPIYFRPRTINPGFTVDHLYMYLSLHNIAKIRWSNGDEWDQNNDWTTVGHRLTSINTQGHMLALNIPWDNRPSLANLPNSEEGKAPSEMLIIGCEDAEGAGTDHDVNDVVFMVIGFPNVPKVIPTTEIIKKRYMCEDLGATDDFDFNDIVVDVTQTQEYTLQTSTGDTDDYDSPGVEITGLQAVPGTLKQSAKIPHVCGTLPFQVQVGNYLFPKVTDPQNSFTTRRELWGETGTRTTEVTGDGWNPNEEKTITGWNPNTNNIKIYVDWHRGRKADGSEHTSGDYGSGNTTSFADFANGQRVTVSFPDMGSVPYIIATDPDVPWMKERADIPAAWLTGDMTARTNAKGETTADAGSCLYYTSSTGDGSGYEDVAVIWSGSVKGSKDAGGVVFSQDGAEHQAMTYAINSGKYNVINVYSRKVAGGKFGLKLGDGTKRKLDTNDATIYNGAEADYFYQGEGNVGDICCTSIVLSDRELYMLTIRGLFISCGVDGLEITKVTMSRGQHLGNSYDEIYKARYYDVFLSAPANGSITASDRERQAMVLGTNETTGAKEYEQQGIDRLRVPYTQGRYMNEVSPWGVLQTTTLTAVPDEGYRFVKWSDDVTTASRVVNAATGTESAPLTAIFESLYHVHFVPQELLSDGTIGYGLSGKCHLDIEYNGETVRDEIYVPAGAQIKVTPVAATGYEFLYWWQGNNTIPREMTITAPSDGGTESPVYGVFQKKSFTVTLHPDNGCIAYISAVDGVAVDGKETTTGSYKYGTVLTLKAEAKDGYTFVKWSNGDTNAERTLTVTSEGGPYAYSERTKTTLSSTDISVQNIDGNYLDWHMVKTSDVIWANGVISAFTDGKKIRFILDFSNQSSGLTAVFLASADINTEGTQVNSVNKVFKLKDGNTFLTENNAAFDSQTRTLTFELTKAEFDQYFMNSSQTVISNFYFGYNNYAPKSIMVQVVD